MSSNKKIGGNNDAGTCGNYMCCRVPPQMADKVNFIATVNDKTQAIPLNAPFKMEHDLAPSSEGSLKLKFNGEEHTVVPDIKEFSQGTIKRPEDVQIIIGVEEPIIAGTVTSVPCEAPQIPELTKAQQEHLNAYNEYLNESLPERQKIYDDYEKQKLESTQNEADHLMQLGRFSDPNKAMNFARQKNATEEAVFNAERDAKLRKWDSEHTRESWEKGLIAKAKAAVAGADREDFVIFELPKKLPLTEGDIDLEQSTDDEIDWLTSGVKSFLLATRNAMPALFLTLAGLKDSAHKRLFWVQMSTNGKARIKRKNGFSYVIFSGTTKLKNTIRATWDTAESVARASLTQYGVSPTQMDDLLKTAADQLRKQALIQPGGYGYKMGAGHPKIALLEEFTTIKGAVKGTIIGAVIGCGIDFYTWFTTKELRDKGLGMLLSMWSTTAVVSVAATALGVAAATIVGTIGAPVWIIVGTGVFFAFAFGIGFSLTADWLNIPENLFDLVAGGDC